MSEEPKQEKTVDWDAAYRHVLEVLKQYGALIGMRGVNPYFGMVFMQSLLKSVQLR